MVIQYKKSGKLDCQDAAFMLEYNGSIVHIMRMHILMDYLEDLNFRYICEDTFSVLATDINDFGSDVIKSYNRTLSDDQRKGINACCEFIVNSDKQVFGLYGSAGSGKTTVISHLISFLINNGYVKKIAVSAPTNQALKVLESKIDIRDVRICYKTIQSVMGYVKYIDNNGNLTFVKGSKTPDLGKKFDIVFIDECSMLSKELFTHILSIKNCKVIFIGDIAQLPPVNEVNSLAFSVVKDAIIMNSIMRNNFSDVIGICNEIRDWVMNVTDKPNLSKHILKIGDKKVFAYRYDQKLCKVSTMWFKTAQKYNKTYNNVSNVILAWTNMQCNEYNNTMREGSKEEYKVDDVLIFTSYYFKDVKYHSSCQVRVTKVDSTTVTVPLFNNIIADPTMKNNNIIQNAYNTTIAAINNCIKRTYKVWVLTVIKLLVEHNDEQVNNNNSIIVVKNTDQHKLVADKENAKNKIRDLLMYYQKHYKNEPRTISEIENFVIKPLWLEWNSRFNDAFASVNSAFSITVHKAQGITCYNVFADGHNILKNTSVDESKRCLYTAVTRGSNTLHLLM